MSNKEKKLLVEAEKAIMYLNRVTDKGFYRVIKEESGEYEN